MIHATLSILSPFDDLMKSTLRFSLFSAFLCWPLAGLMAQEEAAPAPAPAPAAAPNAPREPLVARAPVRAEWTVRITEDMSGPWSSDDWSPPPGGEGIRSIRSLEYEKDGELQTYRIRTRWTDGTNEDEWIVAGAHVAERPGGRGWYIVGNEAMTGRELARSDFPELGWLEMDHFRGVRSYRGKPVFVFQVSFDQKRLTADEQRLVAMARQNDPNVTPSQVLGAKTPEVVVYLDAASQLPVLYNDGTTIRQYSFSQPSGGRLRPPAQVLQFLRARNDALRARLTAPAGPGG